jgi:hypothetical protein
MRAEVLMKSVLALVLLLPAAAAAASRPPLTVYMVQGKESASILADRDYRRVFTDSIFKGDDVSIDTTSGPAAFFDSLFESQVAYLSLHASESKYKIGSGDVVDVDDVVIAYKAHGYKGPALVVVTGCSTTKNLEGNAKNLPKAFGILPDTKKRAYIGFPTFKVGLIGDRYFRAFFATWLREQPDGRYPTIEEARTGAAQFIKKMRGLQSENTAKIARFEAFDADTAEQLTIVGDSTLRVTDLAR